MKRLLVALSLCAISAACGSESSSTAPTPTPPTATTKNIVLSGSLAFGNVNIGTSVDRTFTIGNTGSATLTFTGMTAVGGTGTAGYAATPVSGTVAPGGTQTITVRFSPTIAQFYSNVLTIASDRTTGGNEINISGTGVNPNPLFARAGTGDTVFDMPTYVARIRITGSFTGNSSNFIVKVGGRLLVNELLGRAWSSTTYDGTLLTTGGVVEITNSSGVAWTFNEVRQ